MELKVYKFDKNLTNAYVSLKIDGVQAVRSEGQWNSKAGKPLYNLPDMPDGVYEAFLGDWSKSISAVRTKIDGKPVKRTHLYLLQPVDPRLKIKKVLDISAEEVKEVMDKALDLGYEGLCIISDEGHFKVKDKQTYDVVVTGVTEGKGKHTGKIGAMMTDMGKVGGGLTDYVRQALTDSSPIGKTIEVECMELTPAGKFRHPRFKRMRPDKD